MSTSSTQDEYFAISEICKEIILIKQVLEFLGGDIEYPIIVNVDNVGAIYLAQNCDGKRMKHMDVRYHFLREYIEKDVIKIIFVKSKDN